MVVILHFLQSVLDNRRAASTLRVYMAVISATHARVDNQTVGSHYLITQFLKGAQRLQPPPIPEGTIMGPASSSEVLMSTPI